MNDLRNNVLLAMSGGVDSSVAAKLLLDQGYAVTGVFMCLGSAGRGGEAVRGCCSPTDAADARRVADALGIDLFVLNFEDVFAPIIDDFLGQYARGRTPNPCIHCNSQIKFGRLLERADQLGVAFVATGHHARVVHEGQRAAIARGRAGGKDQSYALFAVARSALPRMLLPIGELADKASVRAMARDLGLSIHDKPDSQEVCFVPDDDFAALLRKRLPEAMRPGDIVDATGKVLGQHDGYGQFTIGQRRGLRVAALAPRYVTAIDPATATVTLGPREALLGTRLTASGANWHREVPAEFTAVVQIRYNHRGAPARVRLTGPETFEVEFDQSVSAITPGQAAVVYEGDILLGGGWID
ncbi:MAG: tRNA 2-thiouridine(34) synthase MnmA [Planctomycetaceae bacterium]|nr:tRNA 2-thiouridine(34) synthase MnmA [Planctomycetaceae bacterium]